MAVRRDLEELLSLSVLPLVDARDELKEISYNSEGNISLSEETDTQSSSKSVKEVEKVKSTDKFQDLVKKHEAASAGEDICVPSLFSYSVPEDKNSDDYEEKRKQRLSDIEGVCKSGPSNLCRSSTVWKGNKEKEELDRKWAE